MFLFIQPKEETPHKAYEIQTLWIMTRDDRRTGEADL